MKSAKLTTLTLEDGSDSWTYHDRRSAVAVGPFANVVVRCRAGPMLPYLLFYERVGAEKQVTALKLQLKLKLNLKLKLQLKLKLHKLKLNQVSSLLPKQLKLHLKSL